MRPLLGSWARRAPATAATLLALALVAASCATAIAVNRRGLSHLVGERIAISAAGLTYDPDGLQIVTSTTAAAGTTQATAVEMTDNFGTSVCHTALTQNDQMYVLTVKENANNALGTGTFKVELFQNGASKGALYMKQGTAQATKTEGCLFRWDLGASVPAPPVAWRMEVTQVA